MIIRLVIIIEYNIICTYYPSVGGKKALEVHGLDHPQLGYKFKLYITIIIQHYIPVFCPMCTYSAHPRFIQLMLPASASEKQNPILV